MYIQVMSQLILEVNDTKEQWNTSGERRKGPCRLLQSECSTLPNGSRDINGSPTCSLGSQPFRSVNVLDMSGKENCAQSGKSRELCAPVCGYSGRMPSNFCKELFKNILNN